MGKEAETKTSFQNTKKKIEGLYSRTVKEAVRLTRSAARIAKPFWSSLTSHCYSRKPVKRTPGRSRTKGRSNLKRRVVRGGKSATSCNAKVLDRFIGTWDEIHSDNYRTYLVEAGVSSRAIKLLEKYKTWVSYSRDGDEWVFTVGFLDYSRSFKFKLGKKFYSDFVDGTPMKVVITQDGSRLKERQETYRKPQFIVTILWEVKGDRIIRTSKLNDVTMIKIFARR